MHYVDACVVQYGTVAGTVLSTLMSATSFVNVFVYLRMFVLNVETRGFRIHLRD